MTSSKKSRPGSAKVQSASERAPVLAGAPKAAVEDVTNSDKQIQQDLHSTGELRVGARGGAASTGHAITVA